MAQYTSIVYIEQEMRRTVAGARDPAGRSASLKLVTFDDRFADAAKARRYRVERCDTFLNH
jgi:hypothetical protein